MVQQPPLCITSLSAVPNLILVSPRLYPTSSPVYHSVHTKYDIAVLPFSPLTLIAQWPSSSKLFLSLSLSLFTHNPLTPEGQTLMNMETFAKSKLRTTQFESKWYPCHHLPIYSRHAPHYPHKLGTYSTPYPFSYNMKTFFLRLCRDKNNTERTKNQWKFFPRTSPIDMA